MTLRTTTRLQKPLVAWLTGVCLFMQIIDASPIWQTLLVVLGGTWLISWLWVRSLAGGLVFSRRMRYGWTQVGDHLEERFSLAQNSWAPATWLEIEDQSDLPDHEAGRATGVEAHSETAWKVESVCTRRGVYTLGPTRLYSSDPFGIYKVTIDDPTSRLIMVVPPVINLPGIQIAPGGRSGDGHPRPYTLERSVSSSGVREYIPGDGLHLIHWRTTARRDHFFVRLFDGTPAGDWRIVVDLNKAVQAGTGWETTEEHAIILAASLLDSSLRQRRPTGLVVNGTPFAWLPSRIGEDQRWQGLRALALAHPGPDSLAELLRRFGPDLPARSSLLLITADTSLAWLPVLLPLMWRGVVPTVLLLDADAYVTQVAEPDEMVAAEPRTGAAVAELARSGIHHAVITPDMLDRPETRPGQSGTWEWRATGQGRAVAIRKPSDISWKPL